MKSTINTADNILELTAENAEEAAVLKELFPNMSWSCLLDCTGEMPKLCFRNQETWMKRLKNCLLS